MQHRSCLRRGRVFVALALAAVVLAGCGDDDEDAGAAAPSAADLEGSAFTSTSVTGAELAPGATLVVTFEDGRIALAGGCNGMSGTYEIDGETLVVPDQLAQTMMACDQPLMDQDTWVAEFVTGGPTIALDGDELTLSGDDITVQLSR